MASIYMGHAKPQPSRFRRPLSRRTRGQQSPIHRDNQHYRFLHQEAHRRCRQNLIFQTITFFASPDASIRHNGLAVRFGLPCPSCAANQMRSLFITPVEPEVAFKATEKVASGPRSAIRRQRTVRGPHARLSAETRRRRMLGIVSDARPEDFEVQILEPPSGGPPNESEMPSGAPFQSRAMRMFEQERMRLRDTLSFERQHAPTSEIDGPLMPPVPESRDYARVEQRQREIERLRQVRQDLRRMARRQPAPTPPYTDRDIDYMARRGTGINSPRPSSLTPALSPSHQPSTASSPLRRLSDDFSVTAQATPYAADVSVLVRYSLIFILNHIALAAIRISP